MTVDSVKTAMEAMVINESLQPLPWSYALQAQRGATVNSFSCSSEKRR